MNHCYALPLTIIIDVIVIDTKIIVIDSDIHIALWYLYIVSYNV